jgi:hypothetical protein
MAEFNTHSYNERDEEDEHEDARERRAWEK